MNSHFRHQAFHMMEIIQDSKDMMNKTSKMFRNIMLLCNTGIYGHSYFVVIEKGGNPPIIQYVYLAASSNYHGASRHGTGPISEKKSATQTKNAQLTPQKIHCLGWKMILSLFLD